MANQKIGDISQFVAACEDKFVSAARDMNTVVTTVESWKRRYTSKNYYNGFKSALWLEKSKIWENNIVGVVEKLAALRKDLRFVRGFLKDANISTERLGFAIDRLDSKYDIAKKLAKDLHIVTDIVTSYAADDPINCYTAEVTTDGKKVKNKDYKDLSSMLQDVDRVQIDSFVSAIINVGSLQHIYQELYASILPLISNTNVSKKEVAQEVKADISHSLKDQLARFQTQQNTKDAEENKYNQWVTFQYKLLESLAAPKTRLLTKDEEFGICELPIVLVKSFVREDCRKHLARVGYKLTRILGNYTSISNALLFGIRSNDKYEGLQNANAIWKIARENVPYGKNLAPVGPLVKKGSHFYSILIPSHFMQYRDGGFVLSEWDISLT